jgi:hypothetical protein
VYIDTYNYQLIFGELTYYKIFFLLLHYTKMEKLLLVLAIILVIMLIYSIRSVETMTVIRRGVGADPDGETPVASGVIVSYPDLDYTHTWSDGTDMRSCDECPNAILCPKCPNMQTNIQTNINTYESFDSHPLNHDLDDEFLNSREAIGAGHGNGAKACSYSTLHEETLDDAAMSATNIGCKKSNSIVAACKNDKTEVSYNDSSYTYNVPCEYI